MIGMNFIILIWALSTVGWGVSRIWKKATAQSTNGRMLTLTEARSGTARVRTVSGAERSCAHRKWANRSSAVLCSIRKNAKKNGIVMSMGMHPATGFTLCFLYSSIVAACCFWGLSLYFSRTAFSSGAIFWVRLAVRAWESVIGRNRNFRLSVVWMIARPQSAVQPCIHVMPVIRSAAQNRNTMLPKSMTRSWSFLNTSMFESLGYSFGPT